MQIYIALISLQRTLRQKKIFLLETPDFVTRHNFSGIEILDRDLLHLDRGQLTLLRNRCNTHQCGIILDANCDLTLKDDSEWHAEVAHVRKMLDTAYTLGASVLRVTLGGQSFSIQKLFNKSRLHHPNARTQSSVFKRCVSNATLRRIGYMWRAHFSHKIQDLDVKIMRAVDAIKQILPRAEQFQIRLAIENHWGISSRPEWILRVLDHVDSCWLGTCLDFGNFPSKIDRYEGLHALAPKAFHVQAKSWHFDSRGNERTIDYSRCFEILRQHNYAGAVSVEYEGGGDELVDCIKARDLITRVS